MKVKRQKRVRKTISFYASNYGFAPPYNVLLDGTFCRTALKSQLNISEQLAKYLEGEVKLSTTNCVIAELEALGTLLYGPLKILRQFPVTECPHKESIGASDCLKRIAYHQRKRKQYFIATQDPELSDNVRLRAGIPLLFISHNAIILEAPSEKSKHRVEIDMNEKKEKDMNNLSELKKQVLGEEEQVKKKKKKGPKGPNPLSRKKAKSKGQGVTGGKVTKSKRKRHKRVHIPDHVKEHIGNLTS